MTKQISIITATYNNANTISDTIQSLEQQSIDFNWLIQDGLSSDDTLKIIKASSLSPKIVSEKDYGLYDALNKAIPTCDSEIIGLCHADDVLASSDVLEKVESHFSANPNTDAIYMDLEYWNHDFTKRIRRWKSGKPEDMCNGWMPPHPTVFIRKKVLEKVGLYLTDIGSAADYEWLLRAIQFNKINIDYLPILAVKMRVGGMSSSGVNSRYNAFIGDYMAWKLNGYSFPLLPVLKKKLRKISQFL